MRDNHVQRGSQRFRIQYLRADEIRQPVTQAHKTPIRYFGNIEGFLQSASGVDLSSSKYLHALSTKLGWLRLAWMVAFRVKDTINHEGLPGPACGSKIFRRARVSRTQPAESFRSAINAIVQKRTTGRYFHDRWYKSSSGIGTKRRGVRSGAAQRTVRVQRLTGCG